MRDEDGIHESRKNEQNNRSFTETSRAYTNYSPKHHLISLEYTFLFPSS
jgi:hypothetical protein